MRIAFRADRAECRIPLSQASSAYPDIEFLSFSGIFPPGDADFVLCPSIDIAERRFLPDSEHVGIIAVGDASDIELCLELGCADYLRFPWLLSELIARIRRLNALGRDALKNTLRFEGLRVCYGSSSVQLGMQEKVILDLLYRNIEHPVSRDCIHAALGSIPNESRSIDMHISNIRKKIRLLPIAPHPSIKAVRKKGYILSFCGKDVEKTPPFHKAMNDKE
jgi:DNA-binding cell septation regulator SpoVG